MAREKDYHLYSLAITHLSPLESQPLAASTAPVSAPEAQTTEMPDLPLENQPLEVSAISVSAPEAGNNMEVEDPANSGCMRPIDRTDRDGYVQWRNCVYAIQSPKVLQEQLVNNLLQEKDAEDNAALTDQ